jgi:hypothetical protein
MLKTTLSAFAAVLLALGLAPAPAQAQRVFVAAQGSDSNPCTFAMPCRTFQHAHDTVAAGGEIDVLDPAGYGVLTIGKAISIQGHGFAAISAPSGMNGISITAPAGAKIILNGLLLDGGGVGNQGIVSASDGELEILNCVVRNFFSRGIHVALSSGAAAVIIASTLVAGNGSNGIDLLQNGGSVNGVLDHVTAVSNAVNGASIGQLGAGAMSFTVRDSVLAQNGFHGLLVESFGPAVNVMVQGSAMVNNADHGVVVTGTVGATTRVTRSVITGNAVGWEAVNGGTLLTYLDNSVDANGTDGTAATIPLH